MANGTLSSTNSKTMRKKRARIIQQLQDSAYRRAFVEGHAQDGIAFQLRSMRKARRWEQSELAQRLGKPQPMVSRYENPDYGKYSVSTLLELAAAFDVGLVVRFSPFSELIEWDEGLSTVALNPKSFTDELPELWNSTIEAGLAAPLKDGGRSEGTFQHTPA